jgi:CheY-like chemotaxis protein
MSLPPSSPKFNVLLVEDSDDDAFFFQRATRSRPDLRVTRVREGEEAKQYLLGAGKFADRQAFPTPDAVLSDLKMPLCTGTELAGWLRSRTEFAQLPVVIVSSSNVHADMDAAQAAGATAYLVKPSTLAGYEHLWDAFRRICSHRKEFSVTLPNE